MTSRLPDARLLSLVHLAKIRWWIEQEPERRCFQEADVILYPWPETRLIGVMATSDTEGDSLNLAPSLSKEMGPPQWNLSDIYYVTSRLLSRFHASQQAAPFISPLPYHTISPGNAWCLHQGKPG